jgi:curved DNA-binding protein CbpA
MIKNPYKELKLKKESTQDEIKSKFRELSKIHHPDVKGTPDKFIKIKLAYDVLCDPERKKLFDEEGIILTVNEEKQIHDTAKHNIVTLLKSIIENKEIMMKADTLDMVKIMVDNIKQNKTKVTMNIGAIEQQILAIKGVRKRMKCSGEEDLLSNVLKIQIKEKEDVIKKMSNELKIIDYMTTLLEDYNYNFDQQIIHYVNMTSNYCDTTTSSF